MRKKTIESELEPIDQKNNSAQYLIDEIIQRLPSVLLSIVIDFLNMTFIQKLKEIGPNEIKLMEVAGTQSAEVAYHFHWKVIKSLEKPSPFFTLSDEEVDKRLAAYPHYHPYHMIDFHTQSPEARFPGSLSLSPLLNKIYI